VDDAAGWYEMVRGSDVASRFGGLFLFVFVDLRDSRATVFGELVSDLCRQFIAINRRRITDA